MKLHIKIALSQNIHTSEFKVFTPKEQIAFKQNILNFLHDDKKGITNIYHTSNIKMIDVKKYNKKSLMTQPEFTTLVIKDH